MLRRALFGGLFCALALAAAGCGGDGEVPRPTGERTLAPLPNQCDLAATYTDTESIAAFEPIGNNTQPCGGADLLCSFFLNHDSKHSPGPDENDCKEDILNGALVPDSGLVESLVVNPGPEERCGSSVTAMHFVASNLSMCLGTNGRRGWGLGWEVDFGPSSNKGPIDASAWDGFSFWVKKGTGPSESSIIVAAVDRFATGGIDEIDPETGEAISCTSTDPVVQPLPDSDSQKCDPFVVGVSLTTDWTFIAVHFSDMRQKGFGTTAPDGLDISALARLQVLASAGNWDFWIDDIAFFKDP